jgi:hypothetical protein
MSFTKILDELRIEYALGGSGLLYSMNLIDKVNDWDITTDCPQKELTRALDNFEWAFAPSGDYPFASLYRISIPRHNIDIIGKHGIHTNQGICELPTIFTSSWKGIKIGSPEVWFVAYTLMGRHHKASLLYNYLERNGADSSVINKLLFNGCLSKKTSNKLQLLLLDN